MNFFIFVGPPGAGKGTQSALLQERLGFVHVSTGTLIRKEIASKSTLGLTVKELVESGGLVDDVTILKCLQNSLKNQENHSTNVVLLDGIPRNLNQAKMLDELLDENLKGVIALNARPEELIARFSKRWHCTNCGRVESFESAPLPSYVCQSCGLSSHYIRRKDDEPEIILSRFKIYEEQTAMLLEFYKKRKMLYEFDALESVEVTYVALASVILQKIDRNY